MFMLGIVESEAGSLPINDELQLPVVCGISQYFLTPYEEANYRVHLGEDRACVAGTPISSLGEGEVVYAQDTGVPSIGKVVSVKYRLTGDVYVVGSFWHLQHIYVIDGDDVFPTTILGTVGNADGFYDDPQTAQEDGFHLHWEIRLDPTIESYEGYPIDGSWCDNPMGVLKYVYVPIELTCAIDKYTDPTLFIELYNRSGSKKPSKPVVTAPVGEVAALDECVDVDGNMEPCIEWNAATDAVGYDIYLDNELLGRSYYNDRYFPTGDALSNLNISGVMRTLTVRAFNPFGSSESNAVAYSIGPATNSEPTVDIRVPDVLTETSADLRGFIALFGDILSGTKRYFFRFWEFLGGTSSTGSGPTSITRPTSGVQETDKRLVPDQNGINTVSALTEVLQPEVTYAVELIVEDSAGTTLASDTITFTTDEFFGLDLIDLSEADFYVSRVTCAGVELGMKIPDNVTTTEIYRDANGTNRTPVYRTRETGRVYWTDMNSRPVGAVHEYDIVFRNSDDEQEIADVESWTIKFNECLEPSREIGLVARPQTCDGIRPVTMLSWVAGEDIGPMYRVTNLTTGAEALVDASTDGANYQVVDGLAYGEVREYQVSSNFEGDTMTSNPVTVEVFSDVCATPVDTTEEFPRRFGMAMERAVCHDNVVSVRMFWTESRGADTYRVTRTDLQPFYVGEAMTAVTTDLTFADTGLVPGGMYSYKVTAENQNGSVEAYREWVIVPGDICSNDDIPEVFDLFLERPWCDTDGDAFTAAHWNGPTNVPISHYTRMSGAEGRYDEGGSTPLNSGEDPFRVRMGTFTNVLVAAHSDTNPEQVNWSHPGVVYTPVDYCGLSTAVPSVFDYSNEGNGGVLAIGETSAFMRGFVYPNGRDTTISIVWGRDGQLDHLGGQWVVPAGYSYNGVPVGTMVTDLPCQRDISYRIDASNQNGTTSTDVLTFRTDDCTTPQSPTLSITSPAPVGDRANEHFMIKWEDDDVDSEALVTIGYTRRPDCSNATEIVSVSEDDEADSFLWNTTSVPPSFYHISGTIVDDVHQSTVCAGPLLIEHPDHVFVDEFNDEFIDTTKWVSTTGFVSESEGTILLDYQGNQQYTAELQSQEIPIDWDRMIIIERRRRVLHIEHPELADNYLAYFRVRPVGAEDKTFGVVHAYYAENIPSSTQHAVVGMKVYRNNVNVVLDGNEEHVFDAGSPDWDMWVTERLVYDPLLGFLTVLVDDEVRATLDVGAFDNDITHINLEFTTFGWHPGKEHEMDIISLWQEDRTEAWEHPGVLFTDLFEDDVIDESLWIVGDDVYEANGRLYIDQNVGESVFANTIPIEIDTTRPVEVHWQGSFYAPFYYSYVRMSFVIDGSSTAAFGYQTSAYRYTYNQIRPVPRPIQFTCTGERLFRNNAAITTCHELEDITHALNAPGQFQKLVYTPSNGMLRYYKNDVLLGEHSVGAWNSSGTTLRIKMEIFGFGTSGTPGQPYIQLRDFTVRQHVDPPIVPPPPPPPDPATVIFTSDFEWGLGDWTLVEGIDE